MTLSSGTLDVKWQDPLLDGRRATSPVLSGSPQVSTHSWHFTLPSALAKYISALWSTGSASLTTFRVGLEATSANASTSRPESEVSFIGIEHEIAALTFGAIDQLGLHAANISDWDPIPLAALNAAKALFLRILEVVPSGMLASNLPHVSSDAEGGVIFEWWREDRSLTLFVLPDESTSYLLAWGANIWSEMESGDDIDDPTISRLWRHLNESE